MTDSLKSENPDSTIIKATGGMKNTQYILQKVMPF